MSQKEGEDIQQTPTPTEPENDAPIYDRYDDESEGEIDIFNTCLPIIHNTDVSDTPYPQIRIQPLIERMFMNEASSSNVPQTEGFPNTRISGTPTFSPAPAQAQQQQQPMVIDMQRQATTAKPYVYDRLPTLPSANAAVGSMLTLPQNIASWEETMRRWESNTITHVASKQFASNEDKVNYIENLLGESMKLYFQSWRTEYPENYQQLITSADDTINVTTQIRQIIFGYDEYRGQTEMQLRAKDDLARLTISSMADIGPYSNTYLALAARTGEVFVNPEMSAQYFRKLPPPFNTRLQELWTEKYPNFQVGILPRIDFTYRKLQELCRANEMARQAKDFSFCRNIEVPGQYSKSRKPRKQLHRSTRYNGRNAKNNQVRKFRSDKRQNYPSKCKCYICGEPGHFAKNCRNSRVNKDRLMTYEDLDLDDNWDIISLEDNEDPADSDICSFSDDEQDREERNQYTLDSVFMIRTKGEFIDWNLERAHKVLTNEQQNCKHEWIHHSEVSPANNRCYFCRLIAPKRARTRCGCCNLLLCSFCARLKLGLEVPKGLENFPLPQTDHKLLIAQQAQHITDVTNENTYLKNRVTSLEAKTLADQLADLNIGESVNQGLEKILVSTTEDCSDFCGINASIINNLLNFTSILRVEGSEYVLRTILDTGATKCCIIGPAIPQTNFEKMEKPVTILGLSSQQNTELRLKKASIILDKEQYPMPLTYVTPPVSDNIELILGMNFVNSFKGGIDICQGVITFYRKLDTIQTTPIISRALKDKTLTLEVTEEYNDILHQEIFLNIQETEEVESLLFNLGRLTDFEAEILPLMTQLEELQYIGINPLQHWEKNKVMCKLDIINPDLVIQDKPLTSVPPAMEGEYKMHIEELLKLKVIRNSHSRHRTNAFIVMKHSEQVRGKSRMVYNYKRLNDNTNKDQYTLPTLDYLLLKIKEKNIFSKFDLKSGFHQIMMHPDSIEWTAFICPLGHFEWLVMPFGLKNAPAVFQRKMDTIFNKFSKFMCVYIDDILIFSDTIQEHIGHLKIFFETVKKEGLILSKNKINMGVTQVNFLGLEIGNGKIQLQPHIVKKILEYPDQNLETLKGLQGFLGILNYARNYIPNLSRYTRPLYNKCSLKGERKFNRQDWEQVKKIKSIVRNLPPLQLPPEQSYLIIEVDGSLDGWGGILKWKKSPTCSKSTEKVARYVSGTYQTQITALDAEIMACIYSLDKFKIFLYGKKEYTVRTDCESIISFYNKLKTKRLSINRWVYFMEQVNSTGVQVHFEHISGKDNIGADRLSRIISTSPYK